MNQFVKLFGLGFGLILLLMWVGSYFGQHGLLMGLVFGGVGNFFMYWYSDKLVLKMNGAQPITETEAPEVYRIVKRLTEKAGMPMPQVYAIPLPVPNAFATGRNPSHAAVAVSPALVEMLSREELEGVIAHELAHIRHRDILLTTLAACAAGAITHLAYMAQWAAMFGGMGGSRDDDERGGGGFELLAMIILAPLAAMLIQMAISRSREFAADEGAARMTGRPLALASALQTIHAAPKVEPGRMTPATASLFIDNPFTGASMMKWFSTHPPMEERIARLQILSEQDLTGIHS